MPNVAVLRQRKTIFASLPEDIDDTSAQAFLSDLLTRIKHDPTKAVVVDVSALEIVDSFLGRIIANVANCASMLDAQTVVCGIRPSVAMTLVELGMEFPRVAFALNIEQAMDELEADDDAAGE